MAKNWADNYSQLISEKVPCEKNKEWRFALEEHKTRGTMQINIRKFSVKNPDNPDSYEGPTKNGFIEQITSLEDVEKLEKTYAEFFKKIKEFL